MLQPDHELHVVDGEITIDFDVPLPTAGADDVLIELLTHHAMAIIDDRKRRDHPLDDIPVARVAARQGTEYVEIAVLDLQQPELAPEVELPPAVSLQSRGGYDLLAKFGERAERNVMPLAERRTDELVPLAEEVRLTAGIAAGLRSLGIDPEQMTASDLGRGLLRLSGYDLSARSDGSFIAAGHGTTTLVSFVDHKPGEYPELAEQQVTAFLVAYAEARTERALLLTDKYGPYVIYQKERANPDTLFVSRERLQDFVDAVALS